MRSYREHLKSLEKNEIKAKPVFRASSLFPVMQNSEVKTRVLFLGYWLLKRGVQEITALITLREETGDTIYRTHFPITEAKAFQIELEDLLGGRDKDFKGSLECEFYSSKPLVFPYPATTINFYGETFSTVVHTTQRVYNDFEDLQKNQVMIVPESGFTIFADENTEPVFAVVNGPVMAPHAYFDMTFINSLGEVINTSVNLGRLEPYQTSWIFPTLHAPLNTFLQRKAGTARVQFSLDWIYSRLLVGNMQKNPPSLSITHTYYDLSHTKSASDYWERAEPPFYPATLMIPLLITEDYFTHVTFYPIFPPSTITLDVELYDKEGKLLGKKENALLLVAPLEELHLLSFNEIARELHAEKAVTARIIAKGDPIPARIKLGLDIGRSKTQALPCNICTNLQPFIPSWDTKPTTFKWCPVLDRKSSVIIVNSSQHINYTKEAEISLTFYRKQDTATLHRKVTLPPNGSLSIKREKDDELQNFLGDTIGWMAATSSNAHILTYYFTESSNGSIGGDHGF